MRVVGRMGSLRQWQSPPRGHVGPGDAPGSAGAPPFGDIMMRSLGILLLLPMLFACDDSTAPEPDTSHLGVYVLHTVDGQSIPVSFDEDGGTFTVVEGSMTLSANGTFAFAAELEFTFEGTTETENESLTGTFTRSANTVTFVHAGVDAGFETATLSGGLLTTSGGGGEVLVFKK